MRVFKIPARKTYILCSLQHNPTLPRFILLFRLLATKPYRLQHGGRSEGKGVLSNTEQIFIRWGAQRSEITSSKGKLINMCCVYRRLCLSTSFLSQGYMFFIRTSPPPTSLIYKMTWNPNPQVFVSRFILKIEIRIVNIVWASLTMECPWTYLQSPRYNQYSRLVHMVDVVDHKNCACHWVFLQNF